MLCYDMLYYGMFILNNVLNGKYHTDEQEIIQEIKHIPCGMVWYGMVWYGMVCYVHFEQRSQW